MKAIIASLILAVFCIPAFGQGVVNFNNNVLPPPPDRLIRFPDGTPVVGTNYVAQLYYGATPDSLQVHTAAPSRFRVPTTQSPGTWSGGNRTLIGGGVGTTLCLQVRIWDSTFGTFEQSPIRGVSDIFPYTQQLSSPAAPSDTWMINFQTGIICVPEPSVALLGIAGLAVLRLCRRKT